MGLDEIKLVKSKHSKIYLKKYNNLVGVGIGYKKINGKSLDKLSLVFMVEKKLPKNKIAKSQLLPSNLDGVESDVVEIGKVYAQDYYYTKIRPAQPGYSIGHPDVTAGTLGCIVMKGLKRYILSNNHILADINEAEIGDPIYQPGVADGGTSADVIAYLDDYVPLIENVNVDCAIAEIADNNLVNNDGVWGTPIYSYADPQMGDIIYKCGRTTGQTSAAMAYTHADVVVNYGLAGNITIADCFMTGVQSDGGDSGSVGRLNDTKAVGLLFAGSFLYTIFSYMSNVVESLGITFPIARSAAMSSPRTTSINQSHKTTIKI